MEYISTRGGTTRFSAAEAIKQGHRAGWRPVGSGRDPLLELDEITRMADLDYAERAVAILLYLTDYSRSELTEYVDLAYSEERFSPAPAPLLQLNQYVDREYILELWHGPTAAFKDIALQLLPYLMKAAVEKTGDRSGSVF